MAKAKRWWFAGVLATVSLLAVLWLALIPIWDAQRLKRHLREDSPLMTTGEPEPWPITITHHLAERWEWYAKYWGQCLSRVARSG